MKLLITQMDKSNVKYIVPSLLKNCFTNESFSTYENVDDQLLLIEVESSKQMIGVLCLSNIFSNQNYPITRIKFYVLEEFNNFDHLCYILSSVVTYLFESKIISLSVICEKNNTERKMVLKNLKFKKIKQENILVNNYEHYFLENPAFNFVYILRCQNGNLYTGWTNNLSKRLEMHNSKKGAKYTKAFGPCTLVYYEIYATKEEAMKREYEIKHLTRKQKEMLINE